MSHANVRTRGVDQAPSSSISLAFRFEGNADECAAGHSCTMQCEGSDYSADRLTTQKSPKSERGTERNRKRKSLTDREVRKPLGTDGKQIQGMRPLLNREGFRQRTASLLRGVDVRQLNVLMTVYGLAHTGHIDPVCL